MSENEKYQVMARSMRPQKFEDVVGQEKAKTTLKNAFLLGRLGHAYLFSGSHGIGKTTLARLFAKVLNCDAPQQGEPCNQCSSCMEIAKSYSLDVIEIDGASNRGIDDIRQINESVGFASRAGKYKIYILDEVHMLTKEAFNALLKTLEDPPRFVKFLFATTEPHKIPATILSRCQCFYLETLSTQKIADHVMACSQAQGISIEKEGAALIAERSNGSLRDALVLADQLITYCKGDVSPEKICDFLGLLTHSELFKFDILASEGKLESALNLSKTLADSGKDLMVFLDFLCQHFRQILYIKVFKGNPNCLKVREANWPHYQKSASCYSYEQCLHIIDIILEAQGTFKKAVSKQIALENLLLQIVRSHQRVSVKSLINQLESLKANLSKGGSHPQEKASSPPPIPQSGQEIKQAIKPIAPTPAPQQKITPAIQPSISASQPPKEIKPAIKPSIPQEKVASPLVNSKKDSPSNSPSNSDAEKQNICYNTLMQFAAVELEGSLKKEGS